ncbi:hypothetical protein M5G07_06990 [Serratia symbiotica]|nr:hypothetical protein [Serratia symbiotica]
MPLQKMPIKYDQTELETAILNAVFGAYVSSPYDPKIVKAAMEENFDDTSIGAY